MSSESLYERLAQWSELVPETAELSMLRTLHPKHVNLSASRIAAAALQPEHAEVVDAAVAWAQRSVGKGGNRKLVAMRAVERLPLEFARRALELSPGQVSIEIDGRLAYKRRPTIDRVRQMAAELGEVGVDLQRVLFRIPATWDGIEAAAKLAEKDGLRCHLTLVFGIHQLAACADAGAAVVSAPVGRISDWFKKEGASEAPSDADPGALAVAAMHAYLKRHGYATALMPCTFRSADQALALAGCDRIALPPALVDELRGREGEVERRVDGDADAPDKLTVDQASFTALLAADAMSTSKLNAGVQNLSWSIVSQEKQLSDWITTRQDEAAERTTAQLFATWDYDGDGYIDREEWSGSEAVFKALDRDNNGRISLEEMAVGLGAPHRKG